MIDEVSVCTESNSMNENSAPDDDNDDKVFLPPHVVVETIFKFGGKIHGDPDNAPVDPSCSLLQFKATIANIVLDYHEKADLDTIKCFWKWEKRAMAQSAIKKGLPEYVRLTRDDHWAVVQQLIREAFAKKNGLHNMSLKIRAEFNLQGDSTTMEDNEDITEHPVGHVCILSMSSNV
jgi:hypothetical protein